MIRLGAALRSFGRKYPLTIALLIQLLVLSLFVWSLASYGTIDVTDGTGQPDITYIIESLNTEATFGAILLVIVGLLGWGKACLLTTRMDVKGLKWAAPLVGFVALLTLSVISLIVTQGTQGDQISTIWSLVMFSIAVGVFEETLYRGTLFHGLSHHLSPFGAMMVSSALFGLFHMQNVVVGQALDATAFQSLNAFALGVLFCAVMLQTNSIWWAIALHAIWDLLLFSSAYISQSQPELFGVTADEISGQPTDITAAAFLLPTAFLAMGLLIFSRWHKRMHLSDAAA